MVAQWLSRRFANTVVIGSFLRSQICIPFDLLFKIRKIDENGAVTHRGAPSWIQKRLEPTLLCCPGLHPAHALKIGLNLPCFILQGDANNLHGFEVDQYIYLLMKKLAF
jgi:hypothetical protein